MRYAHSEKRVIDPDWLPPDAEYGNGLLPKMTDTDEEYAVITMEIPWGLAKDRVAKPPKRVALVENMRFETLAALEESVPPVDLVIGLGGGSAHDSAKYVAIKKDARLLQVPTIISGDACVTDAVGIRDEGRVTYIGHAVCDKVVVDFTLLREAPARLVRYGAGDILSSHTGLCDWKIACEDGQAEFNEKYYAEAKRNLKELHDKRYEIRDLSDEGIRTIIDLYRDYARIAARLGNDRCQEGSEHFFAYNAEYVTGRTYLHGGLLATGIFVMTYIQDNEHEETRQLMKDMGIEYGLGNIGLTREEFFEAMTTLKSFVSEGGYYYSVIDAKEITAGEVEELYARLK